MRDQVKVTLTPQERAILLAQAREARSMHEVWMQRGRSFLEGEPINFPVEFAMRDDMCPIGIWLRERMDPRLRELNLYARTSALHNDFHADLGRLFREPILNVSAAVSTRFYQTGNDLTECIEDWILLAREST